MTSDQILAIAHELNCKPDATALTFARIVAERCAMLAHGCHAGASPQYAAQRIRSEFDLPQPQMQE